MRVARWARCACVWHGGRGVQDNADGGIQDSTGYVLPPFIVVERGESLNEWVDRVAPDFVTSMFVLCHVTKRLQLLHSAGLCHRDLKPGNILWRPTANAWTLIDFGCAEPIGAPPPPSPGGQHATTMSAGLQSAALCRTRARLLLFTRQAAAVPGARFQDPLGRRCRPCSGMRVDVQARTVRCCSACTTRRRRCCWRRTLGSARRWRTQRSTCGLWGLSRLSC